MKFPIAFFLFFLSFFISCEGDSDNNDDNPCLIDQNVNFRLNLDLPLYADLKFSGNDLLLRNSVNFIEGVYITRQGDIFTAIELAEPNNCLQTCSSYTLKDGFFTYSCDDITNKYDISGNKIDRKDGEFNMRRYNTSLSGNILTISY